MNNINWASLVPLFSKKMFPNVKKSQKAAAAFTGMFVNSGLLPVLHLKEQDKTGKKLATTSSTLEVFQKPIVIQVPKNFPQGTIKLTVEGYNPNDIQWRAGSVTGFELSTDGSLQSKSANGTPGDKISTCVFINGKLGHNAIIEIID